MMLAIDTSSAASSVALLDANGVIATASHVDARRHAEVLAGLIEQVLAGRRPSRIAVGVGPGPYTGLRVGVVTAQVLAHAWQVPVVGVCSLDALAFAAVQAGIREPFGVASDARRREIYWARYDAAGERVSGPHVQRASTLGDEALGLPWIGEGVSLNAELRPWPGTVEPYPSAAAIGQLAGLWLRQGRAVALPIDALAAHGEDDGSTADALVGARLLAPYPLYVRRPDAAEPAGAR